MELEDDFQFRPKSDEIDYSLESTLRLLSRPRQEIQLARARRGKVENS